jgi:hypothetical protein
MPKIPTYSEWYAKTKITGFKRPQDSYLAYIDKVLLAQRSYPKFYSAEQFHQDVHEALDGLAGTLSGRLTKPAPVKKEPGSKPGPGPSSGKPAPGPSSGKPGPGPSSGGKSVTVTGDDDSPGVGNGISGKKGEKPKEYDGKPEFGDMELRKQLFTMAKNPDLKLSHEDDNKVMESDFGKWGMVRLSSAMSIQKANLEEFRAAAPGSLWLGFVRIGRRIDRNEDKVYLIELAQTVEPGRKFAQKTSTLVAGEPWHSVCLDKWFAANRSPDIKVWNGFGGPAAKDKPQLSTVGCFFGFFLIKSLTENPANHYWNFRCASLNKWANSLYSDFVPNLALSKMTSDQRAVYTSVIEAARSGFRPPEEDLHEQFVKKGISLSRAALTQQSASKKVPLSWAKRIFETVMKK